jgi:hypothetical protein
MKLLANQGGQAMLEALLFLLFIVLFMLSSMGVLAGAIDTRRTNLENYYALPAP